MANTIEVVIKGKDDFTGTFDALKGALTGAGNIAAGTLTLGLGAATVAFGAMSAALAISVKEAMDAEVNMALLDSTLKAVTATAAIQAKEWQAVQGQFVEATRLSSKEIGELTQKSSDLEFAIRKEEDALRKATSAKNVDSISVEGHQRALEKLRREYDLVNGQIGDGAEIFKVGLADALGLVQPQLIMTRQELIDLSLALRDMAGGSDDAVLGVDTMLLRMGVAKDIFPQATQAILDASVALGRDLQTTALMVGKTLLAPGEGLAKLKSLGVDFTKSQEEMLKKLIATGKGAEAQKFILDALAQTTGGAAAAKAATFSGQLEIMRGHLLEVAEGVGNQLLPILSTLAKDIMPVVERGANLMAASFSVLLPHLTTLGAAVGKLIGTILGLMGIDLSANGLMSFVADVTRGLIWLTDQTTTFVNFLNANLPSALANTQAFLKPLTDAYSNLFAAFTEKSPQMEAAIKVVGKVISDVFGIVAPQVITSLSGIINGQAEIWRKHGDTVNTVILVLTTAFSVMVAAIGGSIAMIAAILNGAVIWFGGIFDVISLLLQGKWSEALNTLIITAALAFESLLLGFDTFGNSILSLLGTNMETLRITWQTNWTNLALIVSTTWTLIQNAISAKIIEIINNIKGMLKLIGETIAGFQSAMVNLGRSLIGWLLDGIKQETIKVMEAVRGAVTGAIGAAQAAFAPGAQVVGSNLSNVNDAIISPGGRIITTSPQDYLVATKNPSALFGGAGGMASFNIANLTIVTNDPGEMFDAIQREARSRGYAIPMAG